MNIKALKSSLSIVLSVLILLSAFAVSGLKADAAETAVSVTINDVTRQYGEAKKFFDLCNTYRKNNDLPEWKMDLNNMEEAMVRAAELSLYYSLYSPDGTKYTSTVNRGELIACKVTNYNTTLEQFAVTNTFNDTFNATGVGVVTVNGIKYICVLMSEDTVTEVDSAVYEQGNVSTTQKTSVLPSLMSNVAMNIGNSNLRCGNEVQPLLKIKNSTNEALSCYLAPESTQIRVSDLSVCSVSSTGMIKGLKPGKITLTASVKNYPSISTSVEITVLALSFSNCTVSAIPDQTYTELPIKPKPVIKYYTGETLVEGTDYTLSYSDNINVGTASILVTGINNYYGQSMTLNFNIVGSGNQSVFKVTGSLSNSVVCVGETVICTATCSQSGVQYAFYSSPQSSVNWTAIRGYGTSSTFNYKPATSGKYYIKVSAKDTQGNVSTSISELTVYPQLECTATLNSTTPVLGTSVTITASSSGGISPVTYAFFVKKSSSSTWTTLKGYSTSTTASYKPGAVGKYNVCVKAQSSTGTVSKQYLDFEVKESSLKNTSTISKTTTYLGNTITLKGSATGGTNTYTYAYYYRKSGATNWGTIKGYSTEQSVSFKPLYTTAYEICIKVKDGSGTVAKKNFTLTVKPALKNTSTISKTTAYLGNTITLKGSATGGADSYTYAYYYRKSGAANWGTIKGYSTEQSVSFKPLYTTTYEICIKVKDGSGTVAKKNFTLTVKPALKNTSTISKTTAYLGNTITLKGSATGGAGSYTYAYYYRKSGATNWGTIKGYSTEQSVSFKPLYTTTYEICIKVKDGSGTVAKKNFTLTVKPALKNTSTISKTTAYLGNTITLKGSATGGAGSYTYAYYYKKPNSTSWGTIQGYSTTNSATFKPLSKGTYQICIKVKDASGTVEKKYINLTVK